MELVFITQALFCWLISLAFAVPEDLYENFEENSKKLCPDLTLTENEGTISSPFYPNSYPSHLSCTWHIQGNIGDIVTIRFDDLDIEESCCCETQKCCYMNWLKIGSSINGTERKFCGKELQYYHTTMTNSNKLLVKFHISYFKEGGRGFQFHYKRASSSLFICKRTEFKCLNTRQCVPSKFRCNGISDCQDGSDEQYCSKLSSFNCKRTEFKCVNTHQCVPSRLRCNGIPDCQDGSDEHHCSNKCSSGRSCATIFQCYDTLRHCDGIADCPDFSDELDCGFCSHNLTRCGLNSTKCYNPMTQRCDGFFDCLNGEDELDCSSLCPGKIGCDSYRGCYSMKQRCNGVTQCEDASDELNCVAELCNYEHGGFLCDNGRCIQEVWTCDRTDDCGDLSDEKNCLRNSVLTAALMGSLICALLLVIAISCTCRLHALRMMEIRHATARETPLSRLSREFFFREPPPSYAVAVQGDSRRNLCVENLHYGPPRPSAVDVHRSRRSRGRRPRHARDPHHNVDTVSDASHDRTGPSTSVPVVDNTVVSGMQNLKEEGSGSGICPEQTVKIEGSGNTFALEQTIQTSKSEGTGTAVSELASVEVCDDAEDDSPIDMSGPDRENVGLDTLAGSTSDSESTPMSCDTRFYYCDSDTDPLIV